MCVFGKLNRAHVITLLAEKPPIISPIHEILQLDILVFEEIWARINPEQKKFDYDNCVFSEGHEGIEPYNAHWKGLISKTGHQERLLTDRKHGVRRQIDCYGLVTYETFKSTTLKHHGLSISVSEQEIRVKVYQTATLIFKVIINIDGVESERWD